jgi:hypothetical protein
LILCDLSLVITRRRSAPLNPLNGGAVLSSPIHSPTRQVSNPHRDYSCRPVRRVTYCERIRAIALFFPATATYESFPQTPARLHQVAATDTGSRHEPSGAAASKTTADVARSETREERQTARALLFASPPVVVTEAVSARATLIFSGAWIRGWIGLSEDDGNSSAPLARKSMATRSEIAFHFVEF